MDIDQLKLIIELLGDVTDTAIWVVLFYFITPLLEITVFFIGWSYLIPKIFTGIKDFISGISKL